MKRTVIIDTNLLLLLVVGTYDVDYISVHKRTDTFTEDDYQLLLIVLDGASLVLTPNICTEASNLLWQTPEPYKSDLRRVLARIISANSEFHCASVTVIGTDEFMALGLTDAGILELPEGSGQILTVDLDLHLAALQRGLPTENFNNHRYFS